MDGSVDFLVTDRNGDGNLDLVAIRDRKDHETRTRVESLAGAMQYREFPFKTNAALMRTCGISDFAIARWTGAGRPELVAVQETEAESKETAGAHLVWLRDPRPFS